MKKSIISVYVLFLGLIAGCYSCNSAQNSEIISEGIRIDPALSGELRMKHIEALTLDSAEKRCVDKINEFAFTLLHHIAKDKDKSFVIAPLSLASAIALPGNGDNGEIRDSIELLLGPIDNANSFFKKYLAALPHNEYSDCRLLNYLAVNRDFPINKAFSKAISSNYDAMVENHDFKDTHSVDKINDWFRKRLVEDTIKVINRLDSISSLCLINALEFNALWPPFDKESTLIRPFITDRGDTLQIPIMEEGERYASFVDREGFQAVSMPYYGSCYRMLVVLPKTEKLALFSQSMTHELFINILDSLHEPEEVNVALPRFKSESDLSMTDLLKELLPSFFCEKSIGFNAMSDDLLNPPAIAAINHKTCIEVSEEGNKAQSVTEESWVEVSLKPEVIADHPFLYFIYDEATRAILLMGQFCGDGALFRDGDITLEEYFRNMKNEMN